jgi:hypothetical protein
MEHKTVVGPCRNCGLLYKHSVTCPFGDGHYNSAPVLDSEREGGDTNPSTNQQEESMKNQVNAAQPPRDGSLETLRAAATDGVEGQPPMPEFALADLELWFRRVLQDRLRGHVVREHGDYGAVVNSYAAAEIPDWELRQKQDLVREAINGVNALLSTSQATVIPEAGSGLPAERARAKAEEYRAQAERWQRQSENESHPDIKALCYSDRDACINKMAALLTFAVDLEQVTSATGDEKERR